MTPTDGSVNFVSGNGLLLNAVSPEQLVAIYLGHSLFTPALTPNETLSP